MTRSTQIVGTLFTLTAMALAIVFMFAGLAMAQPVTQPAACIKKPITYTRQSRLSMAINAPGFTPIGEAANWQHWYDAGMPDRFTEADQVIDDRCGNIKVIYDCTNTAAICASHDGRMSPDGQTIAFTVARGDKLTKPKAYATGPYLPEIEFKATAYEIWLYDVNSGVARLLEKDARMPDWPSNTSLVFASSRANTWPAWAHHGNDYHMKELHIYEGDIVDGKLTNIVNRTPHVFAMNPVVLTNGWRCFSGWNGAAPRKLGTPANAWWPECYVGNGTGHRVIANAHGSTTLKTHEHIVGVVDPLRKGVGGTSFMVLRAISEIKKGIIAYTNYYRNNHLGSLGIIFGQDIPGPAEGFSQAANIKEATHPSALPGSGRYTPQVTVRTPYGTGSDDAPRWGLDGKIMGKAGYAAASPEGEFIFTQCDGSCYEATLPENANRTYTGGLPTAHRKIMLAKVPRVTNPRDPAQAEVIACADDRWNCWDARYVVPYRELFGQDAPDPAPAPVTGTTTTLRIVDARAGELVPIPGPNTKPEDSCAKQGCAEPDWQKRITAIRVDRVDSWKGLPPRIGFAATEIVATCPLNPDGSVECVIPCNINYQVRGVDTAGVVVATDNTLHPAVCGEVITCHGCHDAHSEERVKELGKSAEERFKGTQAGAGC
jgi:hypothetical protein